MTHTFTVYPSARIVRLFHLGDLEAIQTLDGPWYSHWRVEFLSTRRKSYLIVVKVPSLFTGIMPISGMPGLKLALAQKVRFIMAKGGLVTGPDPERPIVFRKFVDRSLLGSINDMIDLCHSTEQYAASEMQWLTVCEKLINESTFRYLKYERRADVFANLVTAGSVHP